MTARPQVVYLSTPCAACPHPYNWHTSDGCQQANDDSACDCIAFATPAPAAG